MREAGDWGLLASLSAMWGTAFLFTKIAVGSIPPTTVVAGRVVIAALVMIGLLRALDLRLPRRGCLWRNFLVLACCGNALPFFLIAWGQQRIDSGLAGILMAVMPLATLFLAHFWVEDERMTGRRLGGFVIGFAGVVALTGPEAVRELGGAGSELRSQLAVLGGALCYAVNGILSRRLLDMHPLVSGTGVMLMASVILLPASLLLDRPWVTEPSLGALGAITVLGLVATAGGTVTYFEIIRRAGPTFLSLINYLIPLIALAAGIVFLDEQPHWRASLGLVLILSGLGLSQFGSSVGRGSPSAP